MAKRKILLRHRLCPGDVACTTSLVRDLHKQYGSCVEIGFDTNQKAIYKHNPYVKFMLQSAADVETIELCYKAGLTASKNGNREHFLTWFYKDFNKKSGLDVKCEKAWPDLHISEEQKRVSPIKGRYWLVFAGGKTDFTVKWWDHSRYQAVVDNLRVFGLRFAQSGATKPSEPQNVQPKLKNTLDLLGWGGVEEFLWQVYHAEGVICPITAAMHIAAGFRKPAVVVAGGREEWWWEAYTNDGQFPDTAQSVTVPHRYLHTQGMLECCARSGCHKNKVVKINADKRLCTMLAPGRTGLSALPMCMYMITVDHVVNAVLSYYEDGTLPPIGIRQADMYKWYKDNNKEELMPDNIRLQEKND